MFLVRNYKYYVTFGNTIIIKPFAKEYSGVRMTVGYEMIDKETGKTVLIGETKHCFTDKNLKPINLKKYNSEFSNKKGKEDIKMKETIIKVEGMVCNGCENRVQNALKTIEGVENVVANHTIGMITITSKNEVAENVMKEKIEDIGFKVKEN